MRVEAEGTTMKKIPSVFARNHETDCMLRDEVTPGCEWVLAGEGHATRKWDGTCVLVRSGQLLRRYDAKRGKTPPAGFEACMEPDAVTGHQTGWIPLTGDPSERWFIEVLPDVLHYCADGTYELCGPSIGANAEQFSRHTLIRHGVHVLPDVPRTFAGMRSYLAMHPLEGIVFHRDDGSMAKVKRHDFALPWGNTTSHKRARP
jgi:hypothetical protein